MSCFSCAIPSARLRFGTEAFMKLTLKIVAVAIGILIVVAIAIPFLIDANTFRPNIESELTGALGREVKVGNLSLALLSGGVTAANISIADDWVGTRSTDFFEGASRYRTDSDATGDQPGEVGERREMEFFKSGK